MSRSILSLWQCNVPLCDNGSVGSIAAASGVCREEKLDVAHGVTNLPLLLLWPSADRTARTTLYKFLYVKRTCQNCLLMHHNQPPATPLTLCWSHFSYNTIRVSVCKLYIVKCTRQNCLVMHHNQPPATPLTLCWSYCSVALYVHCTLYSIDCNAPLSTCVYQSTVTPLTLRWSQAFSYRLLTHAYQIYI